MRPQMPLHVKEPEESKVALESARLGVCIMQAGRFVYANPACGEIFGYTPAELLELESVDDVVVEADRPLLAQKIRLSSESRGLSVRCEFVGLRKDGSAVRAELFVGKTEIDAASASIGVIFDVTGRARREIRLQHRLEHQSSLNKVLHLSVLEAPLEELLGLVLDELFANPWLSIQPKGGVFFVEDDGTLSLKVHRGLPPGLLWTCALVPFGRCLCGRAAREAASGGLAPGEAFHEHRFEGILPQEHYVVPIKAGTRTLGVVIFYVAPAHELDVCEKNFLGAVSDVLAGIIERKQGEQALRRSDAMLRQAQKMEAVGRLTEGVTHDFNNFVSLIIGYSSLLCESLPAGELLESAQAIRKAAKSAASLTASILTFGRGSSGDAHSVDVNEAVTAAVDLLSHSLGKDIRISLDLAPGLEKVVFDPIQLEQILINIAINARDAMPTGGELTFRSRSTLLGAADAAVFGVRAGRCVLLDIADTGEGMSDEVKARLFEPFFTTKPPEKGTGLGLATAYDIVKQNGGGISVESAPGKGACFRVCLPSGTP